LHHKRESEIIIKVKTERGSNYRWVMLGLIWILYASFGLISRSLAPLITPIIEDLQMTYSQMGLVLGAWQLTYIFVAILAGTALDKWGARKALFIGAILISFSAMLRYFPTQWTGLLIAVAVFGLGGPLISIGSPKTISLWFDENERGIAVGIYTTASMLGGLVALSLTNSVVMPFVGGSWRFAFVFYGVIVMVAASIWWFLAKDRAEVKSRGDSSYWGQVLLGMIKLREIQLIILMGFLSFLVNHGLNNWLPNILEIKGFSPTLAGYASSLPTASGIISILVMPRFISAAYRVAAVAALALIAGLAILLTVLTEGLLFTVGLIMFGIAGLPLMTFLILILMDNPVVGSKYMGMAGGIFFCFAEVGGFTGPLIIGTLVDLTGTFAAGAYFLTGALFIILLAALRLNKLT